MKAGGLDYACYYHIKDHHVSFEKFGLFMSPQGNANMAKWWNRTAQFDGLFDFQNRVRPSYYAFKLAFAPDGRRGYGWNLPTRRYTDSPPAMHPTIPLTFCS